MSKIILSVDRNNHISLIKSPVSLLPYLFQKHYEMELGPQTGPEHKTTFNFPVHNNAKVTFIWQIKYVPHEKVLRKAARYYIQYDEMIREAIEELAFSILCATVSELNDSGDPRLINGKFMSQKISKKLYDESLDRFGWIAAFSCYTF